MTYFHYRVLFIISNANVRLFSTTTGEWIRDLEGIAKKKLIGIQIALNNPKLLYGCTEKGDIISWKWKSGVINEKQTLRFLALSNPIVSTFSLIDCNDDRVNGLISWKSADSKNIKIGLFDLSNGLQQDFKFPLNLK